MSSSPLKWHGGKHYLAPRIIALMPSHTHYVEPFFGSGAVLLAKDPEGVSEVANDLDARLMNFWACMRCSGALADFVIVMQSTPFSEELWRWAREKMDHPCENKHPNICLACAVGFFVCCRQSMAGRMESFAPLSKTRVRRGMNEQASAWISAVDGLSMVHARLRRVVVLNSPALEVISREDGPSTLFYLDPPYLCETRTAPEAYRHEMSDGQHFDLLESIRVAKAKVMISGYRSAMYDERLPAWNRHDFDLPNNSASGATKRRMTESLWCNF